MSGTVADNINRQSGVIAEPAGGPEVRSDDPSASAGTVWFNTTSGVLKVYRNITGWSTVNPLLTAVKSNTGAGTEDAGLSIGGSGPTTETEEWDGTSWTADDGNLATGRSSMGGCGTQTAAIVFGGYNGGYRNISEVYNGDTWESGDPINESVNQLAGCGTLTAGLRVGGELA